MARSLTPEYTFDFRGGISGRAIVDRACPWIGDGRLRQVTYWVDDLPLGANLGQSMPGPIADLIDVAIAISIADRLSPRAIADDPRSPGNRWHRRIHVVVPVRHPYRWSLVDTQERLSNLLAFLTDDECTFEFVRRSHDPRHSESQQVICLGPQQLRPAVILLSGGLDSLFGLLSALQMPGVETIVPVTVVTNSRTRAAVGDIVGELRKETSTEGSNEKVELIPTRLHVGISGVGRARDDREPSQRARSLLFLAAGVAVAFMTGIDRLQVCENGVGAISLPMTPDHWGARATKAVHPRTLMLFSELASLVAEKPFTIENLGLFNTKGQMSRVLEGGRFLSAARLTSSCDEALYHRHCEPCGKCTSCILRRVGLIASGVDHLVDDPFVRYRIDFLAPAANWTSADSVHLVAMRSQVEQLRAALDCKGGRVELDEVFPALLDIISLSPTLGFSEADVRRRLERLYLTYVREFDAFMARIDRPGWGRGTDRHVLATPAVAVPSR